MRTTIGRRYATGGFDDIPPLCGSLRVFASLRLSRAYYENSSVLPRSTRREPQGVCTDNKANKLAGKQCRVFVLMWFKPYNFIRHRFLFKENLI